MKRRVLIIAAGIAVALIVAAVLCALPRKQEGTDACISTLYTIQMVKQGWALENRKSTNEVPTDADLFGPDKYIEVKASCPLGGTYTLGAVGEPVKCSVPRHKLPPKIVRSTAQQGRRTE
jgi:hypothetical protein